MAECSVLHRYQSNSERSLLDNKIKVRYLCVVSRPELISLLRNRYSIYGYNVVYFMFGLNDLKGPFQPK